MSLSNDVWHGHAVAEGYGGDAQFFNGVSK